MAGETLQVLLRQPQGLAQVLDDTLHRVGGDGPGQDGVLRPEAPVHPLDQFVPELTGEVQVDVGEQGGILGDEPLQGQAPPQRVHVADADEIARQQGHRGAAPPARGPFFQGSLRVAHVPLLHDLPGQEDYLPVEQQEPGQAVPGDEPELLIQAFRHRPGHRAVPALGGLQAEPPQVGLGGESQGHGALRQGVAQVGGQVEAALLRNPDGVATASGYCRNRTSIRSGDFRHR